MNFEMAVAKVLKRLNQNYKEEFVSELELKKIKIGKINTDKIINYLLHKKLVNYDLYKEGIKSYMINPDGIEYLNNYNNRKRQEEFNQIVAVTGAILALIAIYDFIGKLSPIIPYTNWINGIIIIIVIVLFAKLVGFIIDSYHK